MKHFLYTTNRGRKTLCGVCLRNECTEKIQEVTCPNCLRLIHETDILKLLQEELDE